MARVGVKVRVGLEKLFNKKSLIIKKTKYHTFSIFESFINLTNDLLIAL